MHHIIDVARNLDDGLRAAMDLRRRFGSAIGDRGADGFNRSNALSELVVQLARDGTSLLFQSSLHELREAPILLELAFGLFGVLALGDIAHAADFTDHLSA